MSGAEGGYVPPEVSGYGFQNPKGLGQERIYTQDSGHLTEDAIALVEEFGVARARLVEIHGPPSEDGRRAVWRWTKGLPNGTRTDVVSLSPVPDPSIWVEVPPWARSVLRIGSLTGPAPPPPVKPPPVAHPKPLRWRDRLFGRGQSKGQG